MQINLLSGATIVCEQNGLALKPGSCTIQGGKLDLEDVAKTFVALGQEEEKRRKQDEILYAGLTAVSKALQDTDKKLKANAPAPAPAPAPATEKAPAKTERKKP